MNKYISETHRFIMPLLEKAMVKYPQDSNQFFMLKYHLTSLLDLAERCLNDETATTNTK